VWARCRVSTWGSAHRAQTGHRDKFVLPQPLPDMDLRAVVEVSCGGYHSIGRTISGDVYSWGWGDNGQLGRGDVGMLPSDKDHIPAVVQGIRGAFRIAAGQLFSLAVTRGGDVYCWGAGGSGQLGLGTTVSSSVPVVAIGPAAADESMRRYFALDACAGQAHVVARVLAPAAAPGRSSGTRADGSDCVCMAWGRNNHGQIGLGADAAGGFSRGTGGWADCLTPTAVTGESRRSASHLSTRGHTRRPLATLPRAFAARVTRIIWRPTSPRLSGCRKLVLLNPPRHPESYESLTTAYDLQ